MEPRSPAAAAAPLTEALRRGARVRVLGADGPLRARVIAHAADVGVPLFVVTADDATARSLAGDVAFFLGMRAPSPTATDGPLVVVPELDTSPYGDMVTDARVAAARFAAIARLGGSDPPRVAFASLPALSRRVIPAAAFANLRTSWRTGVEVGHDRAIAWLEKLGFLRADVVEDPGTYAVRGGVLDVFVPTSTLPVRIEWFGDEIERMRTFDPESQRSEREIATVEIVPVRETVATTSEPLRARVLRLADTLPVPTSRVRQVIDALEAKQEFFGIEALAPLFHDAMVPLWEHLPRDAEVIVDDPRGIAALADHQDAELAEEHARALEDKRLVAPPDALAIDAGTFGELAERAWAVFEPLESPDDDGRARIRVAHDREERLLADLQTARGRKGGELLRPVVERLQSLAGEHPPWSVVIASPNLTHAERMVSLLYDHGLAIDPPRPVSAAPELLRAPDEGVMRVRVVAGELSAGYASAVDRLLLLSEADIFGPISHRAKPRKRRGGVGGLGQLAVGDYVVHVTHGVGRYTGLVALELGGIGQDYVLVEYAGTDRLYLPVTRLGEIERYVSAEAKPPKLDKMGGTTFATKTARVKAEVRQIAEELLQVYAQREALGGHAHADGGEPYREFEATFPFEETPDQEEAIAAVQHDLGRQQPMDRLICGDVGFGKTEVALRAAFRVAHGGKQVAVLAPTTVLVQQHYHSFSERMDAFGLEVGVLNRFTDAKSRAATLAGVRDGSVDVVVGTHRLLSTDVRFKDLGLVVIDEEQRFGVTQKERFKKLKTEVDVLVMSATPIPRTLHMSLLGIREISLVMTPPGDRLAVRTFVTRPSDSVLAGGVEKE
ncbi:MAG TPA: DEAD/DEAH box helicase, partial [Nannocystaceae bacterium]|nr:DEAD/DEAH box helicase [Nannocystaceae bacterium]